MDITTLLQRPALHETRLTYFIKLSNIDRSVLCRLYLRVIVHLIPEYAMLASF